MTPAEMFAARMAELRQKYLGQLPQTRMRMGELLARFKDGSADAECREDLRMEAHKLAGSGATFGFEAITPAAKALETALLANATLGEISTLGSALLQVCERVETVG